jgi:hypothetical protein
MLGWSGSDRGGVLKVADVELKFAIEKLLEIWQRDTVYANPESCRRGRVEICRDGRKVGIQVKIKNQTPMRLGGHEIFFYLIFIRRRFT